MEIGQLVRPRSGSWGTGKVLSTSGPHITVEFFESIAVRHRERFAPNALRRARIFPQTRCYILDAATDRWAAGRVGQFIDGEYEVHMPDKRTLYVQESDVYVRCARMLRDPMEVLIHRAHETAFFHDLRYPFVAGLMRQRTAAGGLAGLVSARISLYRHQVEIARRVLSDPVQRYLLADEVGLGKTVEAGVVLRQILLDRPDARALILVPGPLREQWRLELEHKFAVDEFIDRVVLLSTDEWESEPIDGFDLVILDEAQHVAALAHATSGESRRRFELYRGLAVSTPKVLLLSATPALHNEEAFLALLHLLEPAVYSLSDVELLRERLAARQQVGHFLISFNEEAPAFSLRRALARIEQLGQGDPHLEALAAELRVVLDARDAENPRREELVREIRSHVGDQYRLHRRLLRTRRSTVDGGVTCARQDPAGGGGQLVTEYDLGSSGVALHEVLDEWRAAAAREASRSDDEALRTDFRAIMVSFIEAAGASTKLLRSLVNLRLGQANGIALAGEVGEAAANAIEHVPLFEGENTLLQELRSRAAVDERWELCSALLDTLAPKKDRWGRPLPHKVLVFTSFPSVRAELVEAMRAKCGADAVATFGLAASPLETDRAVKRYREDPACWLLICDPSGEEGRNLQFVDWLIHYDIPFAPNRIEQRIGRVDRIGREGAVRTRVFVGPEIETSIFEAWFDVLDQGFGVFRRSIAELQFYVDAQLPRLMDALFTGGAEGLRNSLPSMREGIAEEQRRLAEQHALDEIEALDRKSERYYENLQAEEARSEQFRNELEGWVRRALIVNAVPEGGDNELVRYQPTPRSLIAPDILVERLGAHIGRAGTFDRGVATDTGAPLYRVGEPFVDALAEYLEWDDRGRAYAIWRCVDSLDATPGSEWSGFRFDFIIEPDLTHALEVLQSTRAQFDADALRRRADEYLPPALKTVYLRADGQLVTQPEFLDVLRRPYHKLEHGGTDFSITKHRLALLDEVIAQAHWEEVCRSALEAAEGAVWADSDLQSERRERGSLAHIDLSRRLSQLGRRATLHSLSENEQHALAREEEMERRIRDTLVAGIRNPALRLDSVGFIVLSGRSPLRREPQYQ